MLCYEAVVCLCWWASRVGQKMMPWPYCTMFMQKSQVFSVEWDNNPAIKKKKSSWSFVSTVRPLRHDNSSDLIGIDRKASSFQVFSELGRHCFKSSPRDYAMRIECVLSKATTAVMEQDLAFESQWSQPLSHKSSCSDGRLSAWTSSTTAVTGIWTMDIAFESQWSQPWRLSLRWRTLCMNIKHKSCDRDLNHGHRIWESVVSTTRPWQLFLRWLSNGRSEPESHGIWQGVTSLPLTYLYTEISMLSPGSEY